MKWDDIENAPEDGTDVLIVSFINNGIYAPEAAYFGTYHPNAKGKECWRSCNSRNKVYPTHFMKLPKEPLVQQPSS